MKNYEEAKIVANAIGIISTTTASPSEKLLELISGFCFTKEESEMIKAELINSKCGFDIDRHWEQTNKAVYNDLVTKDF